MKDHHPPAGRRPARDLTWMWSALLVLLLMAGSARAEQPRPEPAPGTAAPAAAAQRTGVIARTGGIPAPRMVSAATARVEIKDYEYLPATLTVPAGTTVTWTSHDDEPHTVTSFEKAFASPGLDADETFSYTFSTPGTYTYHCTLHPQMTGTIIVK